MTTNSLQLNLLRKFKRTELSNSGFNLVKSAPKMEQLFDSSSNSDCSSSNKSDHQDEIKTRKKSALSSKTANTANSTSKSIKNKRLNLASSTSIRSGKTNNSTGSSKSASSSLKRAQSSKSAVAFDLDSLVYNLNNGKYKRVLVLTGAGISTASGIPDFRTPGTGIYDNLSKYCVPYPEAIFEKNYFQRNPRPFFKVAKELMPNGDKYRPNKIHFFLRLLQEKKLLLRLYTQNIDNLETVAGIKADKLIEAHGSFRTATCTKCQNDYPGSFVENSVLNDKIPMCKECNGVVKPDIVFFGEDLPEEFFRTYKRDFSVADLVIVIGTSLEVEPFASIINECPINVPRVLMNKNLVGPFRLRSSYRKKDLAILGDLTVTTEMLASKLGWEHELNQLVIKQLDLINKNQALLNQKKSEEIKKEEEVQKVLNTAGAASNKPVVVNTNETNNQSPQISTPQLKPSLTESQIRAKSILLAKHNILKTTNDITREDKFLCNIFEKYQNLRTKYESGLEANSFRSTNEREFSMLSKTPDSFRKNDPTVNRNKILDIYLIKSQLRLNESFKIADKLFTGGSDSFSNVQPLQNKPLKVNEPPVNDLLPIPMTTSNLVENLNNNRNLYVANSKPLLIKRNLEISTQNTNSFSNSLTNINTVPLLGKINMDKIKMIEKKNNELLLKDSDNYKFYFN